MFHEDWHLGSELSKNKSKRVNKDAGHPTVFHLCHEKPHALGRDGFGALSGCLIEVGDPANTARPLNPPVQHHSSTYSLCLGVRSPSNVGNRCTAATGRTGPAAAMARVTVARKKKRFFGGPVPPKIRAMCGLNQIQVQIKMGHALKMAIYRGFTS